MLGYLSLVEEALWQAAEAQLPAAALAPAALTRAVVERSRRYTSERELLDEPLAGHEAAADLAARSLFFGVADAAKMAVPLAELDRSGVVPARELRLLDLGAGAGATTLGCAATIAGSARLDLSVVAVDRDRAALAIFDGAAGHLARALGGRIALERRAELLRDTRLEPAAYDLIVAGNVLNELDHGSRLGLVERALAGLAEGGALILIEPALRETTRDLHRVRDHVLTAGLACVFAPCTRAIAPCPALARERDWCHEDRPLALPPRAARLAHATGLRDSGMKFSYLVLRRAADPLVAAPPARAALRVVSEPKRLKGRRECIGCGESGWVPLRLLSRRRGDANRAFERLRRGDVVVLDREGLGEGTRDIGEEELVERFAIDRLA
jgi:ribosomal protein RSM22 (predicted rRNA methylase)